MHFDSEYKALPQIETRGSQFESWQSLKTAEIHQLAAYSIQIYKSLIYTTRCTNSKHSIFIMKPGNVTQIEITHWEHDHTYPIIIFDADISSLLNNVFHYVAMALTSRNM